MITVLGASGFIGSNIIRKLEENKLSYYAPARNENFIGKDLGHVIYCIGLTADFRRKPFETVEAHVCLLKKVLESSKFDSLTYLSSTRVYINSKEKEVFENAPIFISIDDPDELYTLTKLTGERLCLSSERQVKIVRLSNVYGNDDTSENFITYVIKKIQSEKFVRFFSTASSAKDYIAIEPLCEVLIQIAKEGKQKIYNVAAGENLSNADIISILKEYYVFDYEFDSAAREIIFPIINIDRIKNEFGFKSENNRQNLFQLIKKYSNDTN